MFYVALLKLINSFLIGVFVLFNEIVINRFKLFKIKYLAEGIPEKRDPGLYDNQEPYEDPVPYGDRGPRMTQDHKRTQDP